MSSDALGIFNPAALCSFDVRKDAVVFVLLELLVVGEVEIPLGNKEGKLKVAHLTTCAKVTDQLNGNTIDRSRTCTWKLLDNKLHDFPTKLILMNLTLCRSALHRQLAQPQKRYASEVW